MNTFKKGKKEVNSTKQRQIISPFSAYSKNLEYGIRKPETKQLELFDEKSLIGQDLSGFVIISNQEYTKLLDAKERLEKFENILNDAEYEVTRAKFYERVYLDEGQKYKADPIWYFEVVENNISKSVTLINAETGKEIFLQ